MTNDYPERKSDTVRRLVTEGELIPALRIAKDFRLGISKEDSDVMKRGFECIDHGDFYKALGYDPAEQISKAISVVRRLYGEGGGQQD